MKSSVSVAIRDIEIDRKISRRISDLEQSFDIKLANNRSSREKAYRLAHDTYLKKGYVTQSKRKILVSQLDLNPDTATLIIEDRITKEAIATLTMNFQEHAQLPSQEIYLEELNEINIDTSQVAEITRLAIKEGHRYSNLLLTRLFNAAFLYIYKVKKLSNVIIEVNPTHVGFYQKLLGFQVVGNEKACGRVNGAPAILLLLDLKFIDENLDRLYRNKLNTTSKFKFFKFALPLEKSKELVKNFTNSHKPMTLFERIYFGLKKSAKTSLIGVA